MPWIRILSGNQAGAVVNQTETEAQANVDTGYAEYVKADETAAAEEPKPAVRKPGRKRDAEE